MVHCGISSVYRIVRGDDMKTVIVIVGIVVVSIVILVVWSCCVVAGRADDSMGRE